MTRLTELAAEVRDDLPGALRDLVCLVLAGGGLVAVLAGALT